MEAAERALFESGVAARDRDGQRCRARRGHSTTWVGGTRWQADRSTAVSVLFECLGAAHATSGALDWLLAAALGTSAGRAAVVLPPLRRATRRGAAAATGAVVQGLGTEALARSDTALVVARTATAARRSPSRPEVLERRPVHGLDPALGLVEVTGAFDARETADEEPVDWAGAVAVGQLALGAELVGTGARHARAGPRARAGTHPVRASRLRPSRRSATGWPRASSPSKPPPPCSTPPGTTPPP